MNIIRTMEMKLVLILQDMAADFRGNDWPEFENQQLG